MNEKNNFVNLVYNETMILWTFLVQYILLVFWHLFSPFICHFFNISDDDDDDDDDYNKNGDYCHEPPQINKILGQPNDQQRRHVLVATMDDINVNVNEHCINNGHNNNKNNNQNILVEKIPSLTQSSSSSSSSSPTTTTTTKSIVTLLVVDRKRTTCLPNNRDPTLLYYYHHHDSIIHYDDDDISHRVVVDDHHQQLNQIMSPENDDNEQTRHHDASTALFSINQHSSIVNSLATSYGKLRSSRSSFKTNHQKNNKNAKLLYWLRLCYYVYLIGYRITITPVDCLASYGSISNNVKSSSTSSSSSSSSSSTSESITNHYFKIKPSDIHVIEGDSIELKCQINPETDAGPVQWAKDGFLLGYEAIIPGHDRYIMLVNETTRTYNLHIHNVKLEDEAEFECQTSASSSIDSAGQSQQNGNNNNNNNDNNNNAASNIVNAGGTSILNNNNNNKQPIRAAANVHLIIPPKVIYINSTRSFDNPNGGGGGGGGSPANNVFQRSNNNNNNNNSTTSSSNNNGNNSTIGRDNLFVVEANEGEKIIIVCTVPYAKPPPRLKWYRKNIELLPEAAKTTVSKTLLSNRHTVYSVESSLVLYPKIDEEYRCQAEHVGLSKSLRAIAQINIFKKPSPPVIDGYKNGDIVNFQEKLTIKCTSYNGYPPPTVIWLRNGIEMDRTFTLIGKNEVVNTLSLVVGRNDHMAQYTCQVINSLTPIPLQETITLNVYLFPTQIRINGPTEVLLSETQGSPITLECNAHPASPTPNESRIRWLIDGKEVNFEGGGNNNNNNGQPMVNGVGVGGGGGGGGNQGNYFHMVKHDQQSWTVRSNLTFVINSKEPNIRNVACIAYSTNGKFETVSTTHQINVIYAPEMPILLGVKNGQATVVAGEIFKCKCVCYSGNPRANLVWLNQHDREISALTTTTGSGVSSELVLRPSAQDHNSVFRCNVIHPALDKPYEVSFTLQVIFPPEQLNITFPKFIKENDTIKIECTSSLSNPCPTIQLLIDGKKIDDGVHHSSGGVDGSTMNEDSVLIETIPHEKMLELDGMFLDDNFDPNTLLMLHNKNRVVEKKQQQQHPNNNNGRNNNNKNKKTTKSNQHIQQPTRSILADGIIYQTDCLDQFNYHHHQYQLPLNQTSPHPSKLDQKQVVSKASSAKIVFLVIARSDHDQSQLTCIANNPLIPNHAIRVDKTLNVYYKPKFDNFLNYIELNEHENYHISVPVRANPYVDNLMFSRVKETSNLATPLFDKLNQMEHGTLKTKSSRKYPSNIGAVSDSGPLALNDFIHDYDNISWFLEPIPKQWHWKLSNDNRTIMLDIKNVTAQDFGLYVARVSNTLGDSLFFIRLIVKTISAINSIKLVLSSTAINNRQTNTNHTTTMINSGDVIMEGDKYLRIQCEVTANPSIIVKWSKQFLSEHVKQIYLKNKNSLSARSNLQQQINNGQHYGQLQHRRYDQTDSTSTSTTTMFDREFGVDGNFLIDQFGPPAAAATSDQLDSSGAFIDWSRSNVTQSVVTKKNMFGIQRDGGSSLIHSELTIDQISFMDAGIYTCITPNDSRRIVVNVMHRPRIIFHPNLLKVAADVGTPFVKFVCRTVAFPKANFNWTKVDDSDHQMIGDANNQTMLSKYKVITRQQQINDDRISMPKTSIHSTPEMAKHYHSYSELIILRVNHNDYGSYSCLAHNQLGSDQVHFNLVQKSFPETPDNPQAYNVTPQTAFLTWDPGFDYGHEQSFDLHLWKIGTTDHPDDSLPSNAEMRDVVESDQPNRSFYNISTNYYLLNNLEPNTWYKVSLMAHNQLGSSDKSVDLKFQTPSTSKQNFQNKPVYASADEQRLNGLIANKIIGEDFLELTILLCLIGLVTICFVAIIFVHWRRRRSQRLRQQQQQQHQQSMNQCPKLLEQQNSDDKILCETSLSTSQQQQHQQDQTTARLMMMDQHHHHHHQHHKTNNNHQQQRLTCGGGGGGELMSSTSSSSSNKYSLNSVPTINTTTTTSDYGQMDGQLHYHHQQQHQQQPPNNSSTFSTTSYLMKEATPTAAAAAASSLTIEDYGGQLEHIGDGSGQHLHHHHHHLKFLDKNKISSWNQHYLTIASPSTSSTMENGSSSIDATLPLSGHSMFPYELTTTNTANNHHNSIDPIDGNTISGVNVVGTSSVNGTYEKLQYVLSHQQITNVHLLPDTLEAIDGSSSSTSHHLNDPTTGSTYQISFAPIHYDPAANVGTTNTGGGGSTDNAHLHSFTSFDLDPAAAAAAAVGAGVAQYSLNPSIMDASSFVSYINSNQHQSTTPLPTTTTTIRNPKVTFDSNVYDVHDSVLVPPTTTTTTPSASSLSCNGPKSSSSLKRVNIVSNNNNNNNANNNSNDSGNSLTSSPCSIQNQPLHLGTLNEEDEV